MGSKVLYSIYTSVFKVRRVRTRASKEAVARVGSVAKGPLASNVLHLLT